MKRLLASALAIASTCSIATPALADSYRIDEVQRVQIHEDDAHFFQKCKYFEKYNENTGVLKIRQKEITRYKDEDSKVNVVSKSNVKTRD